MKLKSRRSVVSFAMSLTLGALGLVQAARADFELQGPDGRTIQLRDDGTWRYAQSAEAGGAPEKRKIEGEAVLTLVDRTELGNSCRYSFQLMNDLPYEIRTIVPLFIAYRANGVVFHQVLANFNALRPGNNQKRTALFEGIKCEDIVRLQVSGADRCTMGELDKYSATGGECLARIRVVPSDIVLFEK